MQPETQKAICDAILVIALLFGTPWKASATAEYDTDSPIVPEKTPPRLAPPPTVPSPEAASPSGRELNTDPEPTSTASEASQTNILDGVAAPGIPPAGTTGQPTYSIRLPLGVPGSVIPKLHSPAPAGPPPSAYLPPPSSSEYTRPVAWRATAEAIRNQPAASNLLVGTVNADFKTTYNTIAQEAQSTGWSLTSLSLPAGHFLLRIPKPDGSSEDAAAWLILVASPIDSASTELRIKIQARRAASFSPAVNSFLQRLQMRATGNKLL